MNWTMRVTRGSRDTSVPLPHLKQARTPLLVERGIS